VLAMDTVKGLDEAITKIRGGDHRRMVTRDHWVA
jgi:hypothetical protein